MAVVNVDPLAPVRNYFPDAADIQGSLGPFMYWFDFESRARMNIGAGHVEAVGTRLESLVDVVFPVDGVAGDYLTLTALNGKQAVLFDEDNEFNGDVPAGPVSEMTAFFVLKGDGTKVFYEVGTIVFDTVKVTVGGGTAVYGSTSLALAVNDDAPHILVIKWDAASGDVYAKVDDSVMELIQTGRTTAETSASSSQIGGTFDGVLGEVMVAGTLFDADQVNAVGQYLCNKWQIRWADV